MIEKQVWLKNFSTIKENIAKYILYYAILYQILLYYFVLSFIKKVLII